MWLLLCTDGDIKVFKPQEIGEMTPSSALNLTKLKLLGKEAIFIEGTGFETQTDLGLVLESGLDQKLFELMPAQLF